jgi:hypothetical protein
MRKFIIKSACFISAFGILLILVLLANKNFASIKIDKNKSIIVLGNSHSECAFNDSIIYNAINFSQSGEANFYTYFKLKKIIELNSRIDTIFIQFSNNQVDESMNGWIWDNMHMSYNLPKYALFMDREGLKLLYEKNPDSFKKCIFPILKNNIRMIFKGFNYNNEIGSYRHLVRNKTDSLLTNIPNDLPAEKSANLSYVNIDYISRSIDYCKQKNIKVFLVRTPVHEKSQSHKNEFLFQKILKTNFYETEFLDFSKYPIANSEFADLEHLNYKGANNFSAWFAHLVQKGMLQKDNKQEFIDYEIKMRTNNSACK